MGTRNGYGASVLDGCVGGFFWYDWCSAVYSHYLSHLTTVHLMSISLLSFIQNVYLQNENQMSLPVVVEEEYWTRL